MFITRHTLPRRTFLRGIGTAVALPFLDAMTPAFAQAHEPAKRRCAWRSSTCRTASTCGTGTRATRASSASCRRRCSRSSRIKDDILLLGNLTHNTGRALLDGAGDHGRCCGSYLTGVQVKKTRQRHQGQRLVRPDRGQPDRQADAVPVARSRARRRAPGRRLRLRLLLRVHQQPGVAERDAAAAADSRSARAVRAAVRRRRGAHARSARAAPQINRRSILDFVTDDTRALHGSLGPTDQRKLDEYLSSIRADRTAARSAPRRRTRRSIRAWRSPTASRAISPSTSG